MQELPTFIKEWTRKKSKSRYDPSSAPLISSSSDGEYFTKPAEHFNSISDQGIKQQKSFLMTIYKGKWWSFLLTEEQLKLTTLCIEQCLQNQNCSSEMIFPIEIWEEVKLHNKVWVKHACKENGVQNLGDAFEEEEELETFKIDEKDMIYMTNIFLIFLIPILINWMFNASFL